MIFYCICSNINNVVYKLIYIKQLFKLILVFFHVHELTMTFKNVMWCDRELFKKVNIYPSPVYIYFTSAQ